MAFSKVVFFKVTDDNDGEYPTYDTTPIKLYSGDLSNNISLELTDNTVDRERSADDRYEKETFVRDASGTLTVYGVDANGKEKLLDYFKDGNNNIVTQVNKPKIKFGAFFETLDQNTNKKVQIYLFSLTLGKPTEPYATDDKQLSTISIPLNVNLIKVDGVDTQSVAVYEDNTGFVDDLPTAMYTIAPVVSA